MPSSPQQQFEVFKLLLRDKRGLSTEASSFRAVVAWLKLPLEMPAESIKEICSIVCTAFDITEEQLKGYIAAAQATPEQTAPQILVTPMQARKIEKIDLTAQARKDEAELERLLPKEGFLRNYVDYTINSEAPMAYHIFCAIAGIAATVNRRVFFDMGTFRLYLPLGILVLGPSGIKKTSAADVIVNLLSEMQLTPIYAEKLTPEALVEAMKGGNATGLVYAPEMTVLVSKQRYMESIIPLLTRFMDSPDVWKSSTIMRNTTMLRDVAITCLMCSTLDWFIKNTPDTIFGGGFIARNIMVLQQSSCRVIALPKPGDSHLRDRLKFDLANMHELQGQMTLSGEAFETHKGWYEDDKRTRLVDHEILETYYQRKPQHLLRIAMCLHLAEHGDLVVCERCWERALKLLNWAEQFLPYLANNMFKSPWGEDQELVLSKIKGNGGSISHSDLVRKMQYKMPARQTRSILDSLIETKVVVEVRNVLEHAYYIPEPPNDDTVG